jgi:hypothetical protein
MAEVEVREYDGVFEEVNVVSTVEAFAGDAEMTDTAAVEGAIIMLTADVEGGLLLPSWNEVVQTLVIETCIVVFT